MGEELIELTTEDSFELTMEEAVESEIKQEDLEQKIGIEESVEVVETEVEETIEIGMNEAIGWVGGDSTRHYSLYGRDEPDQHTIGAITGLRKELDEIERLKTVYSDKTRVADYYLWKDQNPNQENRAGYFVSLDESDGTSTIDFCTGDNIFGVTVDDAAFIGGQAQIARDSKYGLVVSAGKVSVRCESNISVGDYVVPNIYGMAQKADNGYGYNVIALQHMDVVDHTDCYATINLQVQISKVRALVDDVSALDERVAKAEVDIISAMFVATEAHNKALSAGGAFGDAIDKAQDALDKANQALDSTNGMNDIITSVNQSAMKANEVAQKAVDAATEIRDGAYQMASDTLAEVNDLVKDLEPITTWTYVDPETQEEFVGAEYLTTYMKDGLATKAEIQTVEGLIEENKSTIIKNAESFQTLVSSVDKYSVGEFSQSYGLSREQAKSILSEGMIYIPTKHSNTKPSHSETFVGDTKPNEFTPGYYYTWISDDWEESASRLVAFFSEEPTPSRVLKYWYVDSDTAPAGYEPRTLYVWLDDKWTKVNILSGNVTNRVASSIRQTTNEIASEITNARGSIASLSEELNNEKAEIRSLAAWRTGEELEQETMSIIRQVSDDNGASVVIAALSHEDEKIREIASLALTVVDKEVNGATKSILSIDADNVNLTGYVTIEGLKNGKTEINGNCIKTGVIQSNNYKTDAAGTVTDGTQLSLTDGTWRSKNLRIDSNGDVTLKGEIEATKGKIGQGSQSWRIGKNGFYFNKAEFNDAEDGVYIGTDGINMNDAFIVDDKGNVQIKGGLTGITRTIYLYYPKSETEVKTAPDTPNYTGYAPTGWSDVPVGITDKRPYVYVSMCTTDDGKKYTCSEPQLVHVKGADGKDGTDATVDAETVFNVLTANGQRFGCFTDPADPNSMYINANYIRVGDVAIKEDGIQLGSCFIKAETGAWEFDGTVIQGGSITTDKIAANAIKAEHIQAGSIKTDHIEASAIKADHIDAGAITAQKLDAGCITTDKINTGALGGWLVNSEGLISKHGADKACLYAGGLFRCEEIGTDKLTALTILTPLTNAVGGLDVYLAQLSNRIAALEGSTSHTHIWDEGTVITEPTCDQKGSKICQCTVAGCEATETKVISELGHNWILGTISTCARTGCGATCDHENLMVDGVCNKCKWSQCSHESHSSEIFTYDDYSGRFTSKCSNSSCEATVYHNGETKYVPLDGGDIPKHQLLFTCTECGGSAIVPNSTDDCFNAMGGCVCLCGRDLSHMCASGHTWVGKACKYCEAIRDCAHKNHDETGYCPDCKQNVEHTYDGDKIYSPSIDGIKHTYTQECTCGKISDEQTEDCSGDGCACGYCTHSNHDENGDCTYCGEYVGHATDNYPLEYEKSTNGKSHTYRRKYACGHYSGWYQETCDGCGCVCGYTNHSYDTTKCVAFGEDQYGYYHSVYKTCSCGDEQFDRSEYCYFAYAGGHYECTSKCGCSMSEEAARQYSLDHPDKIEYTSW